MNRLFKISAASILFLASSLALACDYPARPSIPDGATASKDELLAAKTDVQDFMAQVDEYLKCIELAAVADRDNLSQEELQRADEMLTKKFDAANEEKALVGEQFNVQIRAYNAKLQADKE